MKNWFVIYDLTDNIVRYCDDLDELVNFTKLRKKQIVYKFKNRDYIFYQVNGSYCKIYKFSN